MSQQKKRNVEAIYALSPMQQGMLFHSLYEPKESLYAVQFSCRLSGKASREVLQQAWQEVVNRHAVLRTCLRLAKPQRTRTDRPPTRLTALGSHSTGALLILQFKKNNSRSFSPLTSHAALICHRRR